VAKNKEAREGAKVLIICGDPRKSAAKQEKVKWQFNWPRIPIAIGSEDAKVLIICGNLRKSAAKQEKN